MRPIPTPAPPVNEETLKARIDQILGTLELVNWMLPPMEGPDFNQDAGQLIRDMEALLLQRAQEIADLRKDNAILRLANPIEEDLQAKIDEALKYLAMEQGFTLSGLARLFVECQRRLADDWLEIGRLGRELTAQAQAIAQVQAENERLRLEASLRDHDEEP